MRSLIAAIPLLVLTACSADRATAPAPQPQKSALTQCYAKECAQPLVLVDGKRYTNPALDLNPNEIESVEVFKGPKAVEVYGEDGRNGVVVITSRQAARLTGGNR